MLLKMKQNALILHTKIEALKISLDNTRVFRHDYNNNLCAIGGYISINDMSGLRTFYHKISGETTQDTSLTQITYSHINEPSIYALFFNKYKIMMQNQIHLEFDSQINFSKLCISSFELCKILGILLDNAIDAAKKSPEKEIIIRCYKSAKTQSRIVISNSYINKNIELTKIFEKGYSTKEVKSGIGLWEVKQLLKSNKKAFLDTQKDKKYFSQILWIQTL
jgi:two-component system sensor histidine kinase AgrC